MHQLERSKKMPAPESELSFEKKKKPNLKKGYLQGMLEPFHSF